MFSHVKNLTILLFALFATALHAAVAPVVVIHGDKSLADAGERRFALVLARHAARWYRDGGLNADVASDADLATTLKGRKIALLVHCAEPDASQLANLRRFVASGGKLIVTFSTSSGLAEIMGVANGRYLRNSGGLFHSMHFVSDRPSNIPSAIRQSSANIVSAAAIPGKSRVLAWWADSKGRATANPAWLASDAGFWMTHVLLADGDASGKSRLLIALSAHLCPSLWMDAARARLAVAGSAGPWRGPDDAIRRTASLRDTPRNHRLRMQLKQARQIQTDAQTMLKNGRGAVAWMLANDLDRAMTDAYGIMQQPIPGEIRAVWDHSCQGLYPGDWPRTCRALKEAGITDILVNAAGPGFAHCNISAFPHSPLYDASGDQLAACVKAAHRHGIRVHAWLICCSTTQATASRLAKYRADGLLLESTDGKTGPWLDPSSTAARAKIVKAAEELLVKYAIDGIHLDFIRYPDYYGSLGKGTRERFELSRGKKVASWPEDAKKSPLFRELVRWRTAQVTALVADIRTMQRRRAPGKLVTAAVLGKYPTCIESVGQDWMSWLECGYIDYAYPMNYMEDMTKYAELLSVQLKKRNVATRVVGGIGVTAAESRLEADDVIDQINALRAGRAAGFALFDLDTTLVKDILPVLRLGVTDVANVRDPKAAAR